MPNWLPAYLDLFALGMLLAVVSAWLGATDRRPALLWHPAVPYASWAMAAVLSWSVQPRPAAYAGHSVAARE